MRAFVTGGTGFVGAHLVRALRAQGDAVTCLVRTPAKARALGWTDVRLVPGDLDDAHALRDGCAGPAAASDDTSTKRRGGCSAAASSTLAVPSRLARMNSSRPRALMRPATW